VRVVLDTNVLVSAFLTPTGAPAEVLQLALQGELVALYDERIREEYSEFLSRKRFGFDPDDVHAVLDLLCAKGELVTATALEVTLPDPDDVPFHTAPTARTARELSARTPLGRNSNCDIAISVATSQFRGGLSFPS
jgi:uncharacterized protein